MRRVLLGFLTALLMLPLSLLSVATAQEATPAAGPSAFAGLGLPELNIMVTATGFEGIPQETEAGRYLVTVNVAEDVEFGGGVGFVRPPEGMSIDEFLAIHEEPGPSEVEGEVPGGTPVLADEATPVASEGGPPAEIFDATYAGGIFALPGQSAQVVLDLLPGEWLAWADDPEAAQEPLRLTVTGEMPADLTEPGSGATIIMGEYVIEVREGELAAGQQVVKIENIGAQPHFIFMGQVPDTVTEADIETVLEAEMAGTPVAEADTDWNPDEQFEPVFGTGTQSGGTTIWLSVSLEPGTYVAVCFFPDLGDGLPHAYHGMYAVLEVSE
jgi:hypothetical protein